MGSTTFGKPIDTEVAALNSKLTSLPGYLGTTVTQTDVGQMTGSGIKNVSAPSDGYYRCTIYGSEAAIYIGGTQNTGIALMYNSVSTRQTCIVPLKKNTNICLYVPYAETWANVVKLS